MNDARVELVSPDPATARVFLEKAEGFVEDAARSQTQAASRQVLAWSSCIASMDAVLGAAGRRVSTGNGAHALRVQETHRQLDIEDVDLFERLDAHREVRHDVSYHAGVISEAEAQTTVADARELLDLARRFVVGEN